MSNVLSEDKKQQVIALGKLGWPLRRIEQATGVRRETAGAYLKAAGIAVRPPGAWGRRAPAKPANEVTTDLCQQISPPVGSQDRSASVCEPYRELIEQGLARGRNAMAIWQDLISDHGFPGGYETVKRFVRKLRGSPLPQAVGIILTAAGEEAQVDYGSGPMVRDPQSGKYRRTRLFVMTLGYSRKSVRLLIWRSSSRVWAELHEKAFRRLGGCPRLVVLDNLREGVIAADIYEPTVNPLFRDVLAHYGVVAMPCRIQDPDRKGKVESAWDMPRRLRSRDCASRAWKKHRRSGSLGGALGRYAHPWHHETAGRGDVRRRKTRAAGPAAGTFPLLPIRRTRCASRRMCRGRSGLLRFTARMDRTAGQSAMGCAARAYR